MGSTMVGAVVVIGMAACRLCWTWGVLMMAFDSDSDDDAAPSWSSEVASVPPPSKTVRIDKSSGEPVDPLVVAQRMAERDRNVEEDNSSSATTPTSRRPLETDAALRDWQAFLDAPPTKVSNQLASLGSRIKVSFRIAFRQQRRCRQLGRAFRR